MRAMMTKRQFLIRWAVMAALLTLVGLLFSLNAYLGSQRPLNWFVVFLNQLLPFLVWASLCPAIMRLDEWVRGKQKTRRRTWPRLVAFHLLATTFFSLAQIALYGFVYWSLLTLTAPNPLSLGEVYRAVIPRILLGVVVYLIIVTTNYALDYYEKYRGEKDRAASLEASLAQAQLHALKMQLQPHFLFNTLNSITSLVLEDQRAAVQMISRLGDFLRLTIENNGAQEVSLERELEFLKGYLEIQQARFRDRLLVSLEIEPETLRAQVPNLILQPLVENALKHGIAPRLEAGRIEIAARRHNGSLQIQISNDGPRVHNQNSTALKEGVGIANTRSRLRQLYHDRFRLDLILAAEGGATCTVEIPWVQASYGKRPNRMAAKESDDE